MRHADRSGLEPVRAARGGRHVPSLLSAARARLRTCRPRRGRPVLSLLLSLWACALSGCDALWGGLLGDNPVNCAFNRGACGPDEICDPEAQVCRLDVRLERAEPRLVPASTPTVLQITGRHFDPGSQLRLDGQLLDGVQLLSDTLLTAPLPARPGGSFRATLELTHPSGARTRRSDLFSYFTSATRFTPAVLDAAQVPFAVALVDVNSDGRSDAVTVDQRSRQIHTYLAQADGTLALVPVTSALPVGVSLGDVLFGDFDHDRVPDLILYAGLNLARLRGDGTGRFLDGFVLGGMYQEVALGDLDGDTRLDAVVLPSAGEALSVVRGLSDGTVAPPGALPGAVAVDTFALGDFDQDGRPDVVGGLAGKADIVLLSHAQPLERGSLRASTIATAVCAAAPIQALHPGDFTGDGLLDVLVLCPRDAAVLRNSGGGRFELLPVSLGGASAQPRVALADFDGDLRTDAALCLGQVFDVRLLVGDAQSGLRLLPAPVFSQATSGLSVFLLVSGDVDGDSRPDLVVGNRLSNLAPQMLFLRNSSP